MSTPAVPLSDVAVSRGLVGGPFGSSLVNNDYTSSGVPVIRGTNLGFGRQLGGAYVFVSDEKVARDLARNTAIPGDIVFTQRGTLGQVALVPDDTYSLFVVSQSQMRLRVDPARAVANYVYYACTSGSFTKQIDDNAISTGVPHINLGILNRLTIPLPSLREQRAIAELLGALDDKIAANTRMAALGDSWVRSGFDLIAAESVETKPLSEIVRSRREPVDPAGLDGTIPYVGLEHIPRRLMWLTEVGESSEVTSNKHCFHTGDILFGKLRPYFHKVATTSAKGICSTDVLVLRPVADETAGYTLAALASDDVVRSVTASSEGTRMPRTNWKDLASVEIPWPGTARAVSFSREVMALRSFVLNAMDENRTLAATRDAILPQLMSGKLRVKDAEKVLEVAGV